MSRWVATLIVLMTLGVATSAGAQVGYCPPRPPPGQPIPVERGLAAAEAGDFAKAAFFFEQNKACLEINRPGVRDDTSAIAAERVFDAYYFAKNQPEVLRVTTELIRWLPSYLAGLPAGAVRSDVYNILMKAYVVRATVLVEAFPDESEKSLVQASAIVVSNPQEESRAAYVVLGLASRLALDRGDTTAYFERQTVLLRRLRTAGAGVRDMLREELQHYARELRREGRIAEADSAEREAGGLR